MSVLSTMTDLSKVAIIGAGSMGSGIAQKSAQEGFSVQMVDRAEDHVERGFSIIRDQLDQAIQRRIFSEAQVDTILGRIEGVVGTESVDATTDRVIEAVFEDLGIKSEVFQTLDAVCGPKTILASNTSSLSVADLASASGRPDRFIGLHFFYHPAKNRLIEVIPGPETSEETLARTVQYCRQTGKVVIVCSDRPGFVVNRFFVPWLNEATRLAEEGIATPAQIDAVACRAFRIGLGPFGLMNLTGPPIALHSTDILSQQLSVDRYHGTKLLRDLVEEERMWDLDGSTEVDEQVAEQIRARLLGVVFGVAAQLVEEQVCSMEDVDRGAKVGLRWGLGPFEMMNELGVARSHDLALAYQRQSGIDASTWALPAWLESQATEDRPFRFRWVDLSIEDGRATVTINRPEAMNALNEEVVEQLHEALDEIDAMDGIRGLVLDGAGKAFVAGADVKFFVDRIRASAIPDIEAFTARGKALFDRIEALEYPTVALTTGLALGGGLELALTCSHRIGTHKTTFRFPETSIGIYPALGGTQRPARICGRPGARWAVLAGNPMDPETALAMGLLTDLVAPSEVEATLADILASGASPDRYRGSPADPDHPSVRFATSFFSDANMSTILDGTIPEGFAEDPMAHRQMKLLGRAAPVGLAMASERIDAAATTTLQEGLQMELDGLNGIFSTHDALEGLSALLEHRRPDYTGA